MASCQLGGGSAIGPVGDSKGTGPWRLMEEEHMNKVAVLIWIMLGITFAGIFGTVILATPSLAREAAETLPWAALAGFIVAIPASIVVAKKILEQTGNR